MQYRITGDDLPVVICTLDAGETVITENGSMSWMSPNMKMETTSNGGIGKAFGRLISGESLFLNRYTAQGGRGEIAFASSFPGSIRAFDVSNGDWVVQKSGFLASEQSVDLSVFFQKKLGAGFFGGEGFIMQRISGKGMAFIEIDGSAVEYDLAAGESTFMVEMSETAYIMRNATQNSLVILDEIGRGTSTFDGLSIAWAAVEYLADKKHSGAKTLFATHYHELSELEGHLEGVVNYCVAVKEHGEEVIFLRKIVPGGADKSFGIYVARLAGLPRSVIARAQEIEARLEVNNINQNSIGQNILGAGHKAKNQQVDLLSYTQTEFVEEIRSIDVLAMTPMEALNKMFLIHEKAMKL